jgi:serine/threonine-protein kinase HipA
MPTELAVLVQIQAPDGKWVDVGYLRNHQERNWFQIEDSYWNLPRRPVLGQAFEEHGKGWRPTAHVALPNWFSHLLPEGYLRSMVARAAQSSTRREFSLLARIGRDDLPGATRIAPALALGGSVAVPPELEAEDATPEGDPLLKFSLAGVQLKFSVYESGRGLTVPARRQAGNVILKLPDERPGYDGVPEAELGCLVLAGNSGIRAADAFLAELGSVTGLEKWARRMGVRAKAPAVRRFDRGPGDSRVHMEEMAQVLNISPRQERANYLKANHETVGVIVSGLSGPDAVGEIIDRTVLNVMVGNGDAHLKNWALLYPDGRRPVLSTAYDIVSTVIYVPGDDLGMKLAGARHFEAVTSKSFDLMGERTGIGVESARAHARDAVVRIRENWGVLRDYVTADRYHMLTERLGSLRLLADV